MGQELRDQGLLVGHQQAAMDPQPGGSPTRHASVPVGGPGDPEHSIWQKLVIAVPALDNVREAVGQTKRMGLLQFMLLVEVSRRRRVR